MGSVDSSTFTMNNILSKISDLKKSISQKHPRFVDSYALEESNLGKGSFATVQCCKRVGQADGETLAVKVFDRTRQKGLRREFRNEAKLLMLLGDFPYTCQKGGDADMMKEVIRAGTVAKVQGAQKLCSAFKGSY